MAECSHRLRGLLLGLVGQAVGVVLLPSTHLCVVAHFGAGVALVFEGFAFLLSDLSGGSGAMASLSTPAALLVTGGFGTGSDPFSKLVLLIVGVHPVQTRCVGYQCA